MRFLMTYNGKHDPTPNPERDAKIQALVEKELGSGRLVDTGGTLGLSSGAAVEHKGGKFTVTDGPFPESKELIVGYAIVKVASRAEAIEMCREFMSIAGEGTGEIRQIMGPLDGPPPGR